jgi:hypothetical protein
MTKNYKVITMQEGKELLVNSIGMPFGNNGAHTSIPNSWIGEELEIRLKSKKNREVKND